MKKIKWIFAVAFMATIVATMFLPPGSVYAFQFDTGNPDIEVRWDNTFKYSGALRLFDQSSTLLEDANYDDGDRNFDTGLISNRVDLLSEFEVKMPFGGLRVSGAGWYDFVYNQDNDNDSPFTNNNTSVQYDEFTDDTRDLHGRYAEVLDAFIYGRFDFGDSGLTLRAGRHTLIYGETLFFGSNGIADAQGPIDLVKQLSVPSSQFREVLRPVEQISANFQITPDLSVGAYYQFRWDETRIPAAGSYLSNADVVGEGAESWFLGPGFALAHRQDVEPDDSGQGGVQVRFSMTSLGLDLGLYAARYHAKTPSAAYIDPVATLGYRWVYAQDIESYGASATGSLGQMNWACEVSLRKNTPLNSDVQVDVGLASGNDKSNRLYAVGDTFHANLSTLYVLQPRFFWEGGAWLFELAYNNRLSISDNASALADNTTRDAWALRTIFKPSFYQVLPGLDIDVPVGVGWNFAGRSSAIGNFNGGTSEAGDLSIGVNATYHTVWSAGLSYVKYFGSEGTYTVPPNSGHPHLSFEQTLADRDFIAFNISRAF